MTMLKPQDIRIGDYLMAADKVIDGGRCRVDNIILNWLIKRSNDYGTTEDLRCNAGGIGTAAD